MALLMAEPQALSSIFCRLCLCLERPCDLCGGLGIGPVPTFGSLIHSAEEHADIRRQPFHCALVCCADLISAAHHVQCFAPSRSIAPQRFRASVCGVGWGWSKSTRWEKTGFSGTVRVGPFNRSVRFQSEPTVLSIRAALATFSTAPTYFPTLLVLTSVGMSTFVSPGRRLHTRSSTSIWKASRGWRSRSRSWRERRLRCISIQIAQTEPATQSLEPRQPQKVTSLRDVRCGRSLSSGWSAGLMSQKRTASSGCASREALVQSN
jgi:hypothetical protein